MNSSLKGRGSNQYSDKPKDQLTAAELVRRAQLTKRVEFDASAGQSFLADGRINSMPDHALAGKFSEVLDDHIQTSIQEQANPSPQSEAVVKRSLRNVSRFEDAILTNHPDSYGVALVDAVYWTKRLKADPDLRREVRTEGSPAARRHAAFLGVVRAAEDSPAGGKLSVDQLASNLDELYLTGEGTNAWGGGLSDSAKLANRYAAASALAQGESNIETRQRLLEEAGQIKATLSERGVQRFNL